MQALLALLAGALFGGAIYLLLSRRIVRVLIGLVLFGNAANLTILAAGRVSVRSLPLVPDGLYAPEGPIANPLPQALILTAIVISFSFFAVLLVLAFRAYQDLGTDDTGLMRVAEPEGEGPPPLGY
ncbi:MULTISPECIES: Na+/H+ antiporter subunit C [unclassified Aureimonas]|uniref:Na+/H+ antiporter subunit C n=1 Tax=unclassified Aureimonas TaxID=2615206 RepID=UPI0006FF14C4|nr:MULTISPECIES: Na+/H+ antiporter subunit C [unclassified Aureimonas]KQT66238.1 cation:proton antiporter [Aureimonas sp. Leaf427]KQT72427.1 cation:proton antiporter [Aureimonas sp. Leaf460]